MVKGGNKQCQFQIFSLKQSLQIRGNSFDMLDLKNFGHTFLMSNSESNFFVTVELQKALSCGAEHEPLGVSHFQSKYKELSRKNEPS